MTTLPPPSVQDVIARVGRDHGRRPRVYLAGPMRGYPQWNCQAFRDAARGWRRAGWEVLSPVESDDALGVNPETAPSEELERMASDSNWLRLVICGDVQAICAVDAIALLPGWRDSSGATVEVALALFLGLPTLDALTMAPVYPVCKAWTPVHFMGRARENY